MTQGKQESIAAYPLQWPHGQARTPAQARVWGQFKGTLDAVRKELLAEISMLVLGVAETRARWVLKREVIVISTNMRLRRDGEIDAGARAPEDPGVAVYFERKGQRVCFACDQYDAVWKNLRAIQKTVEALRGIERWGSSKMLDQAFAGFAALPAPRGKSPWDILGIGREADEATIMRAFREKARAAHPDQPGGSHDAFAEINTAKDTALATLKSQGGAA